MHSFRMLDNPSDLEEILEPVLVREGIPVPGRGGYAAAVEFDDSGKVIAFQLIQTAVFLEGLWSGDHSAHLLSLYILASKYVEQKLGATGVMTITKKDEQGERIGRIAHRLGFETMPWNIHLRGTV